MFDEIDDVIEIERVSKRELYWVNGSFDIVAEFHHSDEDGVIFQTLIPLDIGFEYGIKVYRPWGSTIGKYVHSKNPNFDFEIRWIRINK